jgi:hypothetical protein
MSAEQSAVIVMLGLNFILGIVAAVTAIYANLRRNPPLERELEHYVKRKELERVETRQKHELSEIKNSLSATTREVFNALREIKSGFEKTNQDVLRAIGRIEGKLEEHTAHKD